MTAGIFDFLSGSQLALLSGLAHVIVTLGLLSCLRGLPTHLVALCFGLGAVATFPSLQHVMNLSIAPDSVEYLAVAKNWLESSNLNISVNGEPHPSRYPPGFSVFFVAPGLLLAPVFGDGAGILLATFYSALGAGAAFALGARLGGQVAGLVSCILLLILPMYTSSALELLTYSPASALGLIFLLHILTLGRCLPSQILLPSTASALLLATACRPLSVFLAVPCTIWLLSRDQRMMRSIFALVLPASTLILWYLISNEAQFGSWFRSGYSYWCSVPYDFPRLLWSTAYVSTNLPLLFSCLGPYLLLSACGVWLTRDATDARLLILSTTLFAIPLAVFHLFYFYPSKLFLIQSGSILVPLAALGLLFCLRSDGGKKSLRWTYATSIVVASILATRNVLSIYPMQKRLTTAQEIATIAPRESFVVTMIDPLAFTLMIGDQNQLIPLPAVRGVEYASKVTSRRQPSSSFAPGPNPSEHRSLAIVQAGAKEVFPQAGTELFGRIHTLLNEGRSVYLEARFTPKEVVESFRGEFTVTEITPVLMQLHN